MKNTYETITKVVVTVIVILVVLVIFAESVY